MFSSLAPSSAYCREGDGGDCGAVGPTGVVAVLLGLGAACSFLADAKENNTSGSAPVRLAIGSLLGSNLSLHP